MRGIKRFSFILMLMSVTACAPVAYDATYRSPTGRVSVQTTYTQPVYHHVNTYGQIQPIEVTLYADNSYRGVYFSPIRLVIADNQYVKIPVRDRRGRNTRIFAHYHQKSLHFDADMNCKGIHGASRYNYDKRWDKGHKYMSINAGRGYDLTGLRLQVRNKSFSSKHQQVKKLKSPKIIKEKVVVNKKVVVRSSNRKRVSKQQVGNDTSRNNIKQAVVLEKTHPVNSRAAKVADRYAKNQPGRSGKVSLSKEKTLGRVNIKAVKAVKKPVIVEMIDKHKQSRRITGVSTKGVGRPPVRGPAKMNVKTVDRQNNGKYHKVASIEKTVNVAKKKNLRVNVKGEGLDQFEETKESGKHEKFRGREE